MPPINTIDLVQKEEERFQLEMDGLWEGEGEMSKVFQLRNPNWT